MAIVVGTKKEKAERVPVTFGYMRDDEFETIELQAVLALDAAGMRRTLLAAQKESAEVLDALFAAVGKMLDNTDGVPANWKPKVIRRTGEAGDGEPSFRVPSGEHKGAIWPMSRVSEFLDPQKVGSSRARWYHLINEDDGAVVDAGDVTKLFEQIVGATANRPTVASS